MENDLRPPGEDAMMTSEKRIEIGTTWPSYHSQTKVQSPMYTVSKIDFYSIVYHFLPKLIPCGKSLLNVATLCTYLLSVENENSPFSTVNIFGLVEENHMQGRAHLTI